MEDGSGFVTFHIGDLGSIQRDRDGGDIGVVGLLPRKARFAGRQIPEPEDPGLPRLDEQLLDLLPQCLAAAGLIMVSQSLRNGDQFRVCAPREDADNSRDRRARASPAVLFAIVNFPLDKPRWETARVESP